MRSEEEARRMEAGMKEEMYVGGSNHGERMRIWEDVMRNGIRRGDAWEMRVTVVKLVGIMRTRRRGAI